MQILPDSHDNSLNYPRQYLKINVLIYMIYIYIYIYMVSEGEKTTETNTFSKQNKIKNPNWPQKNIKHVGYLHASLVLPSGREWKSGPLDCKSKPYTIGVYVD